MAVTAPPRPSDTPASSPRGLGTGPRPPGILTDQIFKWVALASGLLVLAVLGLIAYTTIKNSWPWFREEGLGVLADNWDPAKGQYGAGAMIYGTFLVGIIALIISVPVSIGIALFVNEVAPRPFRKPIIYTVDLLAAIPSVVYGLWALYALTPNPLADMYQSISDATSGIPLISDLTANPSKSALSYTTAGLIVAIMITPIITSLTREVFATTPASLKEAAYGMGATRWEMIKGAVFPHSRGGVVSAVIIGLGRAIGETIAVALLIGASQHISSNIFGPGDTLAAIIANQFGEATGTQRAALIGMGVVLLVLTVGVGILARGIVSRYDKRSGAVA
jgi:phosphate transport system permease protein